MTTTQKINESIAVLKEHYDEAPRIALVLGSGLGGLAQAIENPKQVFYGDIPHFRVSTVPGHSGNLIFGKLGGVPVVCMSGRLHYYEGYPFAEVTYPVRVFKALGCKVMINTNACGSLNPAILPGHLMAITDHINFMGSNPLIGPNDEDQGPRFPDVSDAYSKELRGMAKTIATKLGQQLDEGVFLGYSGPNFETPAEIKLFRTWGVDTVGMSTVPEALTAAHVGLPFLGISLITNMAAGILDQKLSHEEVQDAANKAGPKFSALLLEIVKELKDWE